MPYMNLRAEMARNGIKQADLADATGKSLQTINRWLVNEPENVPLIDAFLIKKKLFPDLTIEYLFADDER